MTSALQGIPEENADADGEPGRKSGFPIANQGRTPCVPQLFDDDASAAGTKGVTVWRQDVPKSGAIEGIE
jgi:hypothetical protein